MKTNKILILNYEFPPLGGGASPVSYEIAKGYAKLGHKALPESSLLGKVDVEALHQGSCNATRGNQVSIVTMGYKDLPEKEIKNNITIYRVKCLRSKKEICHPWEQLSYLISAKKFLREHLKENKYDICHCHFIIPTGILALWLKKKYGIPYIVTAHGSDVLGYNNKRIFKYLYPFLVKPWKNVIKNAKFVITPSKFLQEEILKITKEGKFKVIPNGIDKDKFKPLKKQKKILIVARLFENKGVQTILDALKDLNIKNWKVDIVGEGPYRKELEKKNKENGLNEIVKFHGWVENDSKKMKKLYGHASIFISASWFENMSIVLLEALASGCNVIASKVGGNPEVVRKENLFEVRNVEDLREMIKKEIEGKNKREEKLDKKFDWDNIIGEYLGVLG